MIISKYYNIIKYLSNESILKIFDTNTIDFNPNEILKSGQNYGCKYREKKNGFWVDFNLGSISNVDIITWLKKLNCKYNPLINIKKVFISNSNSRRWNYINSLNMITRIINKILAKYEFLKILEVKAKFEDRSELIISSKWGIEYRRYKYLTCYFKIINKDDKKSYDTISICVSENSKSDEIKHELDNSIRNLVTFQSLPLYDSYNLSKSINDSINIDCVATPLFSGRLIHESIGHHTEADIFGANKSEYNYLGKQICSSQVTVVDYANGENVPNNYYIDEEGSYSYNVKLIDKGILGGILSDKDNDITKYNNIAGVVRSYENDAYPLIRMRNTALIPGKYTQNEILQSIKAGIFLNEYVDGYTEANGKFFVEAKNAYIINNGIIIGGIKKVILQGNVYEFINSISMLGSDFKWYQNLWCKKDGFKVPVSCGSPTIKCALDMRL